MRTTAFYATVRENLLRAAANGGIASWLYPYLKHYAQTALDDLMDEGLMERWGDAENGTYRPTKRGLRAALHVDGEA